MGSSVLFLSGDYNKMGWESLIPVGMSLLGGIAGGSGEGGQTQTSEQAPWGPQQGPMIQGFQTAQDILKARQDTKLPGGPWTAPTNAKEVWASDALFRLGSDAAGSFAPWTTNAAQFAGTAPAFITNSNAIATGGIGPRDSSSSDILRGYAVNGTMPGAQTTNSALVRGVTDASLGSMGSLGDSRGYANTAAASALDPNSGLRAAMAGGAAMSANPTLDGQIDAVNRDVSRALGEDTIRGIRTAAMASGNTNSSRAAALEGIATRGAADRMADTAAGIRASAFNNGANLGAGLHSSGLTAAISGANSLNTNGGVAGSLGSTELNREQGGSQFDTTARIGAANAANSADLGWSTADTAARLSGNSQVGNGFNMGLNAQTGALTGALTGSTAALGAGQFDQAQAQSVIDDELARFRASDTRGQSLLNDYWSIVGNNVGSTKTTTTPDTGGGIMGGIQGAVGGAISGLGINRNFGFGGGAKQSGPTFPSSSPGTGPFWVL